MSIYTQILISDPIATLHKHIYLFRAFSFLTKRIPNVVWWALAKERAFNLVIVLLFHFGMQQDKRIML